MASQADITRTYRAHLKARNAGLLALLAGLWGKLFDPSQPLPSLRQLGNLAGPFITQGQASSVTLARAYLVALTTQATGHHAAPYQVPPDVIGTSASGHPITALASLVPAVYMARLNAGQPADMAAGAAQSWVNRLASSEPYRAANATVYHAALNDGRMTGLVIRITTPGCCDFCASIADQGYTPASADFAAHANCNCTASPEVETTA